MKTLALVFTVTAAIVSWARPAAAADPAVERMFKAKCAACHGADGKAQTKQGEKMKIRDMTAAAWKKEFTTDKIKATILDGVTRDKDGVKQEMKPFKGKITDEQVAALADYVRSL